MTTTRMLASSTLGALLLGALPALAASPEPTPALVEKGKAAYARNCVACHGPGGEGDGAAAKALNPKPRNLVTAPMPGGAAAIFEVLGKGKPGTGMIAYKHLSEEDRWAIAHYVAGLGHAAR